MTTAIPANGTLGHEETRRAFADLIHGTCGLVAAKGRPAPPSDVLDHWSYATLVLLDQMVDAELPPIYNQADHEWLTSGFGNGPNAARNGYTSQELWQLLIQQQYANREGNAWESALAEAIRDVPQANWDCDRSATSFNQPTAYRHFHMNWTSEFRDEFNRSWQSALLRAAQFGHARLAAKAAQVLIDNLSLLIAHTEPTLANLDPEALRGKLPALMAYGCVVTGPQRQGTTPFLADIAAVTRDNKWPIADIVRAELRSDRRPTPANLASVIEETISDWPAAANGGVLRGFDEPVEIDIPHWATVLASKVEECGGRRAGRSRTWFLPADKLPDVEGMLASVRVRERLDG